MHASGRRRGLTVSAAFLAAVAAVLAVVLPLSHAAPPPPARGSTARRAS